MEEGANKAAASPAIDESKFTNKVAITILKGASTQGNPSYDPGTSKASKIRGHKAKMERVFSVIYLRETSYQFHLDLSKPGT